MYSALLIVFREVLEAALIVGVVMVATKGVSTRGKTIGLGISGGILGAIIVAFFAESISMLFEGIGQELFNAAILFAAVAMLAWHNIWMAKHGWALASSLSTLGKEVLSGDKHYYTISLVVGLAILREGSEIVLFMYGLLASVDSATAMLTGSLIGLAAGALAGTALYLGLLRIPTRYLFTTISALVVLLAAGMAGQGSRLLMQAGILTQAESLWDTSSFLPLNSMLGQLLHALIGYEPAPTPVELVFYISTICLIVAATRWVNRPPPQMKAVA